MRRSSWFLLLAAALLGGSLLTACRQGEGDRCEVNSDCQAGLVCGPLNNPSFCTANPTTTPVDASADAPRAADAAAAPDAEGAALDASSQDGRADATDAS